MLIALWGFVLALTAGGRAARADEAPRREEGTIIVFNGRADVENDEVVDGLVIFNGPANVAGWVRGDLTSFNGDVRVSGRIDGDVTVMNGRLELEDTAVVNGDVVTRAPAVVAPGARIGGVERRTESYIPRRMDWRGITWMAWLAVSISALVLGLLLGWLLPRWADAVHVAGKDPGPSIAAGLLVAIGIPLLGVISFITIIGIPLGIALFLIDFPIAAVGYVASAWLLGRAIVPRPHQRAVPFLIGLGILRVIAIVPFLGGLAWFVASVYGTGAVTVALFRGRGRPEVVAQPAPYVHSTGSSEPAQAVPIEPPTDAERPQDRSPQA